MRLRLQTIITFSIMTIDTLTFLSTVMARLVARTVSLITQTFLARTRLVFIYLSYYSQFSLHPLHNFHSLWGIFSVETVNTSTLQGARLTCFETFTIQFQAVSFSTSTMNRRRSRYRYRIFDRWNRKGLDGKIRRWRRLITDENRLNHLDGRT